MRCFAAVGMIFALWLGSPLVGAQTSTNSPALALDTLPVGEARELRAQGIASFQRAATLLDEIEGKITNGSARRPDARIVGDAAAETVQLDHFAKRLEAIGEALGTDLRLRNVQLLARAKTAGRAALRFPDFRLDFLQRELDAVFRKHEARLASFRQQVAAGDLIGVERQLVLVLSEIQRYTIFLETDEIRYFLPFRGLLNEIQLTLDAQRWQEQRVALEAEAARERWPNLADGLERCAKELEKGTCLWSGRQCTAVELVEALAEDMQRWQLASLRIRGWQIAALPVGTPNSTEIPAIDQQHAAQLAEILNQVQVIIAADVGRTKPNDAEAAYSRWLTALAKLGIGSWDQATIQRFQATLDPILAVSPQLKYQVAAYQDVTLDYLRWRRRVTSAWVTKQHKTSPPLAAVISPLARPHDGQLFLVGENRPLLEAAVMAPLDGIARDWQGRLSGRSAVAAKVQAPPGAGWGTSRFQDRFYAILALPAAPQFAVEAARLRERLLSPLPLTALSLEVALSTEAAERGSFEHVGGLVRNARLFSLSSGYATLWDQAATIAPCSVLPREIFQHNLHSHVIIEVKMEPTWVQHEAFFISLPQPASASP